MNVCKLCWKNFKKTKFKNRTETQPKKIPDDSLRENNSTRTDEREERWKVRPTAFKTFAAESRAVGGWEDDFLVSFLSSLHEVVHA